MSFNDIFKSSFLEDVSEFSILDTVIGLAVALVIGLFIFIIYKKTLIGVLYSSGFALTLVGLSLVTTLVIMAVTSNVSCNTDGAGQGGQGWLDQEKSHPRRQAPTAGAERNEVLSKEEIQRFLIQAKAEGMYELFLLELTTGLRRGEILALTWDDLNFETGELHISKQVTPVGGKNIISEPKTKAAFRTIILPPVMVGLLREYRKEVFSPLMFPSRIKPNQPIDPS